MTHDVKSRVILLYLLKSDFSGYRGEYLDPGGSRKLEEKTV
jgi:hypothetical protein